VLRARKAQPLPQRGANTAPPSKEMVDAPPWRRTRIFASGEKPPKGRMRWLRLGAQQHSEQVFRGVGVGEHIKLGMVAGLKLVTDVAQG